MCLTFSHRRTYGKLRLSLATLIQDDSVAKATHFSFVYTYMCKEQSCYSTWIDVRGQAVEAGFSPSTLWTCRVELRSEALLSGSFTH